MSRIVEMWRQGLAPAFSALYRANDTAWSIEIDGPTLAYFRVGGPFDLAARLAEEPREVTQIDESARAALPEGGGHVCCGEGALGSDGFFARLNSDGALVWMVFLPDGNPFYKISVDGMRVTFTNNLGRGVTVNLTDQLYA